MIKVKVFKHKDDRYSGFSCLGHAGYADSGEDIVCSGVSALVITIVNAIDALAGEQAMVDTDEESGLIALEFVHTPGHDAALLMDTLVLGISMMAESYSDYIQFEIEEV